MQYLDGPPVVQLYTSMQYLDGPPLVQLYTRMQYLDGPSLVQLYTRMQYLIMITQLVGVIMATAISSLNVQVDHESINVHCRISTSYFCGLGSFNRWLLIDQADVALCSFQFEQLQPFN